MAELKREKEGLSCEVFSEYKIFWEVDSVNTSIYTATHDRNLRISLVTSLSLFPHIPVTKSYQYYLQIVSNASTFLHHQSHWPSVTRATRVTSWLVSNSVLAPSSPFSKSSQSGPILCLSCSEPFRGFHTWLVSPCLPFQPHLKQVHNLLATWPFSSPEKTLSPFLPRSLCTCSSRCQECSSLVIQLTDSFHLSGLVQIFTSSGSSFLTLILNYVLGCTFSYWLKFSSKYTFQFVIIYL